MSRHRRTKSKVSRFPVDSYTMTGSRIEIDESSLTTLAARPSLKRYIPQLWRRRYFIQAEARAKAFQTPRDLWMGKVWLIVSPLIDALMYAVIFGVIIKTNRGIENFAGYVVLGVIFFRIFQQQLTAGVDLIKKQQNLTKSFAFPRAALVFSQSLRLIYDTVLPVVVAVLFALGLQWHVMSSWTIIGLVPLFVLAHIFGTGLMFIAARVTAFYPDTEIIFRLGQRFWFYASGVFFSIERFVSEPWLQDIMLANPAYQFLNAVRDCVLYGQFPSFTTWFYLIASSLGVFILGFLFYWQAEDRYVAVK